MARVTFFNITDPFNMEATPEPEAEHRSHTTATTVPQTEERPIESYFAVPFDQAPGLEALSEAATSNLQYIRPVSIPMHSPGDINASPHSSNNLNFILNPTETDDLIGTGTPGNSDPRLEFIYANAGFLGLASPAIDPTLMSSSVTPESPKPVDDHEISYLLRHFGETTGQW
jgi:hypothetical protein